ncbi:MAG TPA: hypothetical protein VHH34_20660 [Pseudonocardiaceae bacterium]|nr:hypothetical protein [Pseudonocardiaceae bacterium]
MAMRERLPFSRPARSTVRTAHLREHDELAHRQRRAGRWRTVTVAMHLLLAGLPLALLLSVPTAQNLLVVVLFAMGPLLVAWWLEQCRPSARTPQQWWWWRRRSVFVAFPQAIGLAVAVNTLLAEDLAPWLSLLFVVAVPVVPAAMAALATGPCCSRWCRRSARVTSR